MNAPPMGFQRPGEGVAGGSEAGSGFTASSREGGGVPFSAALPGPKHKPLTKPDGQTTFYKHQIQDSPEERVGGPHWTSKHQWGHNSGSAWVAIMGRGQGAGMDARDRTGRSPPG